MSFLKGFFNKSKEKKAEAQLNEVPEKTHAAEPKRTGTTLRTPAEPTRITQKKPTPEPTALEIAELKDWEVKTLSVWQPGDVILDTYEVEDVISGGMGHVYIANHNNWNVKLAIKSPNEMMLADRDFFARVLREANSWTELGLHPNIAYCYYVRNIEDVPHIFVEYVDGGNLRQWIEEGKCVDYRTSLDLAIQFCHGMEHAHSKGMIHRDLKPENILMTKEGVLKITDFGLVRSGEALEATEQSDQNDRQTKDSSLTVVGAEMGTWGYMSPEQKENPHEVDERTDIFAFGICLYEMFCGNRPYEITFGPKQEPPDPVSLSGDESFPAEIGAILTMAVQWEPSGRYKSFDEIRRELLRIYHDLFGEQSPYAELELLDLEADGLNNQGVSYFDLGRKEDAVSCWEKALKINQLHPEATYNLSLIQWRAGKIADDEVLRRLDNCGNYPAVDQERLAELKAFIHAERLNFDTARDVLKGVAGRYEVLFSGKDVDQIESIHTLEGHRSEVHSVAFSPDGRYAVSGSGDGTVRVWELASGRCAHTLKGHSGEVRAIALSPDGRYAVSGSSDTTVRVWKLQSGRCVHTLKGFTEFVISVAVSPDGRYVVSCSGDGTVRVWKLKSGRCVHTLKGNSSVALSADGRYAVSGGWDGTVRVWKLKSGRCVHTLEGHTDRVESVAFSPDGRYAVSGSWDKTVRVWELKSDQCVHALEGHTGSVESVVLSPDGRYAVSRSLDEMRVWELSSGRCVSTLEGHTSSVWAVAVSPDGRYAVSGSVDKTVRVWELASGQCVYTLEEHTHKVQSVAISPDGRSVLTGSGDKIVRVWKIIPDNIYIADLRVSLLKGFKERKKEEDALEQAINQAKTLYEKGDYSNSFAVLYEAWKDTGFSDNELINRLYLSLMIKGRIRGLNLSFQKRLLIGHTDNVASVAISPDGRYAVSGSVDKTVRVWELASGRCVHTLEGHTDRVESVAFSPDGRYVVSGSWDKTVRVWDLASGRCVHTLEGHTAQIHAVAMSPDGRYVVSGSWDKTARVWELASGRCVHTLEGHTAQIQSVAMSPDGRYAVSGSLDKTMRVWDLASGRCVHTLEGHTAQILSVAISPDGRYAVSGSWDKSVRVWDLASGRCVHTLEGHTDRVRSVALSPDGRYVVSGSRDKTVRVWELASGRCVHTLEGHMSTVFSVVLSPDGRYAVSSSYDATVQVWDKTVRVWELASGRCVHTLEGHTHMVQSVAISPDGRYVVSGSWDKSVRVWELIWDLEFPDPVDWDEGVRPYLEIFLTIRTGKWTEEDFQELITELAEKRGYGWVKPEGIRKELEKMTQSWEPQS